MDIREVRKENLRRLIGDGEQKELAVRAKVSPAYLSHIMTGFRNLGHTVARKIERELRLPHGFLDTPPKQTELSPEALEFASDWQALPADVRAEVKAFVRMRRLIGGGQRDSYQDWEDRMRQGMEELLKRERHERDNT